MKLKLSTLLLSLLFFQSGFSQTEVIYSYLHKADSNKNENVDTCLYYLNKAYEYSLQLPDSAIRGEIIYKKAALYFGLNNWQRTFEYGERAYNIHEQYNNHSGKLDVINLFGAIHYMQGDIEKAEKYYSEAIGVKTKYDTKQDITSVYMNMAVIKSYRQQVDSARYFLEQAKAECLRFNNIEALASYYLIKGNFCYNDSNLTNAQEAYRQSYTIAIETNSIELLNLIYFNIARVKQDLGQLDSAIYYLQQSYNVASEYGKLEAQISTSFEIAKHFESIGDYANAYKYILVHDSAEDSLYSIEKSKQLQELQTQFETERNEEKLAFQQEKIDQKTQRNRVLLIALLIAILQLLIIASLYFLAQKKNAIIRSQKDELKTANKTKDKLMSVLAHDLVGPIGSVNSILTKLPPDRLSLEKYKAVMLSLTDTIGSLSLFIQNILYWARNQGKIVRIANENIVLHELGEEIKALFLHQLASKDIVLYNKISELIEIQNDRQIVSLVMRNFVSNALKFTPNGGNITMLSDQKTESVILSVKDTGIGISPENINKIFVTEDMLSSEGTDNERGTGLGLSLCSQFAQKIEAKLWVESELNKGTTFYFEVPTKLSAK